MIIDYRSLSVDQTKHCEFEVSRVEGLEVIVAGITEEEKLSIIVVSLGDLLCCEEEEVVKHRRRCY